MADTFVGIDSRPPPRQHTGLLRWLRLNLFGSPGSTLLTLVVVPVLYSYLVRERKPKVASDDVAAGGAIGAHMPASKD